MSMIWTLTHSARSSAGRSCQPRAEVEEAVAGARPAAAVPDDEHDDADDDRRADERDQQWPAGCARAGRPRAPAAAADGCQRRSSAPSRGVTSARARRPRVASHVLLQLRPACRRRAARRPPASRTRSASCPCRARGRTARAAASTGSWPTIFASSICADGDVERRSAGRRRDRPSARSSAPARRGRWSGTPPACRRA